MLESVEVGLINRFCCVSSCPSSAAKAINVVKLGEDCFSSASVKLDERVSSSSPSDDMLIEEAKFEVVGLGVSRVGVGDMGESDSFSPVDEKLFRDFELGGGFSSSMVDKLSVGSKLNRSVSLGSPTGVKLPDEVKLEVVGL